MRDWTFQSYGPHAWLVRFGPDLSEETMRRALAVSRDLEERRPEGLREFTMGYGSVLLECADDREAAARWGQRALPGLIEAWRSLELEAAATRIVEIPVIYDGEDLGEVARRTGLEVEEVIKCHSGRDYRVWMLGFAPGFPYLGVLDELLHLPRRDSPRARIAAGSVAMAGAQTGIYPSESAGGWHILGRTVRRTFDLERAEPFLLRPGDLVRFVPVEVGGV